MSEHELSIAQRLEAHGVLPTAQRLAIARVLLDRPQHVSADQLLAMVNANGGKASKATIYNTLRLFCDKGLIREVIVDPSRVFYDSTTGPHHHFYNVDTGELTDIPQDSVSFSRLPSLPEGTREDGVDVVVRLRSARR